MTVIEMQIGRQLFRFVRALSTLLVVAVAVPVVLVSVNEWRFDGRWPLHGVPSPVRWRSSQFQAFFTGELTQRTIADIVVRMCLLAAWAAVLVFVLTVVVETAHMVRHGGIHMPDVRGLGWSQRSARVIASGLLALVPLVQSAAVVSAGGVRPAIAGGAGPAATPAAPIDPSGLDVRPVPEAPIAPPSATAGEYVVRPGDSVYAIAGRLAGGEPAAVARLADRIVELNLGREMGDGERFTNAGYIDVGWVLQLPGDVPVSAAATGSRLAGDHVVVHGESLWSIADDELGDPHLWPELYEANAGRRFGDGRVLDDPSVVQPGWVLHVPGQDQTTPPAPDVTIDAPDEIPVEVAVLHDAHHADRFDQRADREPEQQPAPPTVVARPENRWQPGEAETIATSGGGSVEPVGSVDESGPELVTIRRAAMLGAGILTLLAVRRRRRLRAALPPARLPQPTPESSSIERALRVGDVGGRLARVDIAVRAATMSMISAGVRLLAVRCSPEGELELYATGPVQLPAMWNGASDRWTLPASVPIEALADDARQVFGPCPALVQLGVDELGGEVYVDLEAIGALEIGGPADQADAIVAAVAATLASSVLAETTTLLSVGVAADAFLGHRLHVAEADVDHAVRQARQAVGPTATMTSPIFELRARGTAGEQWAPAVVLVGSGVDDVRSPATAEGVALVSASPIHGPSSRLAPEGAMWVLRPAGLALRPIGLVPDDISAIGALVAAETSAPDDTIYTYDEIDADGSQRVEISESDQPEWDLMVRLFGPVEVVDVDGKPVSFERSKTTELVAWLATHRDRSTRSNARTALWEQDVRDATFANVVSEARRSLARLVPPPEGEEWVGRTLSEQLPLHPRVLTDADLLGRALATVRATRSTEAIGVLRACVESIAGLPFEGTAYLWPDTEGLTSQLVLLATAASAELAAHCLSTGDVEGVFEATGRGLRVLPGHEELIALRMRAHAQAGDHAGVRQEWSSYERVINADTWSDGEPSPKLVHLRQQLLNPSL